MKPTIEIFLTSLVMTVREFEGASYPPSEEDFFDRLYRRMEDGHDFRSRPESPLPRPTRQHMLALQADVDVVRRAVASNYRGT